jgi:hypothetical protein
MKLVRNMGALLLSLVVTLPVASGLDTDKGKFAPPDLSAVDTKQTNNEVVIGAVPYNTEDLAKKAFGKVHPYEHGVLPVLIIVQNNSKGAIRLERLRVQYIDASRERIDATPAADVRFLTPPKRPNYNPSPIPGLGRRKNPLAAAAIETRAFAAKMLPPGESAHGFFYFQTGHRGGAHIYITGLEDAAKNTELLFFDIPLN